jgi:hypothetical protein
MGRNYVKSKAVKLAGPALGLGLAIGAGGLTFGATPAFATACPAYSASPCKTAPSTGDGLGSKDGTPTSASGSSLAFTGSDVALTATVGAGAIAAGGMIVLASRRRRVQA